MAPHANRHSLEDFTAAWGQPSPSVLTVSTIAVRYSTNLCMRVIIAPGCFAAFRIHQPTHAAPPFVQNVRVPKFARMRLTEDVVKEGNGTVHRGYLTWTAWQKGQELRWVLDAHIG